MKPETLFRALLPATLFLLAGSVRAQDMADAAPAEVSPASGPTSTPAQAGQKPKLSAREQALLDKYDTNHDGVLDDDELAAAHASIRSEQETNRLENARRLYARLLSQFDTDKKGYLSPDEQQRAVAGIEARAPFVYRTLLQRFDKDGDGKLDADELKALFDTLSKAPEAQAALKAPAAPDPNAPRPVAAARGAQARRLYDDLVARFDASKKGFLDPDEQRRAVESLKTERPNAYERLLNRFDKNRDGQLDAAETKALFDTLGDLPPVPKEKS